MVTRVSVSASRSPELQPVVECVVGSGRFRNFGEFARAALRRPDEGESGSQDHCRAGAWGRGDGGSPSP